MLLLWWGLGAHHTPAPGSLPPPPRPLPLLRNLLQLDSGRLDYALMELSNHWSPVFTVWLGLLPAVVLCGYAALLDLLVLQGDPFSGHGAKAVFERFTHGNGSVFSNGPRWQALCNLALGAPKEFGVGTQTIEERILEEAAFSLGEFQATAGAPLNPWQQLDNTVSNVICSVVFGMRYSYRDPQLMQLLDLFNNNFHLMSLWWAETYNIFPSLLEWIPGQHHQIFWNFEELWVFISEQIRWHQQTRQPGQPWDFIDCFLDQMNKVQEQRGLENHFQEETQNLFFSGMETTSTTLHYGHPILLKYPEVAGNMQIPLVSMHWNPNQFKNPDSFNPSNFLDDKGEFQSNDAFMPFAPGKGMCLGAGLAQSEIFLFLTTILQRFHLLPVGSPATINIRLQYTGLDNIPPAFRLHLVAH